ncbi:MAG TPA: peptide chain release factor N(5)-glutamine methyltransferase [Lactobacillaceae bacterium]|jgi:release factor glutamine methyltransferase
MNLSLRELRKWAIAELGALDEAEAKVDFLLTGATGYNYGMLRVNLERQASDDLQAVWPTWIAQLLQNRPVQYVLGEAPFYGREFVVDERVLIPRPETEELVDWILRDHDDVLDVLDIGTGSGAIALTLAAERPAWQVIASDISRDALRVAQTNSACLQAPVTLVQSDVFDAVTGQFDVIVSNPPYIADFERAEMTADVLDFEPELALFAANDGLSIYEKIAAGLATHLKPNGQAYFEIGHLQGQSVVNLLQRTLPNAKVELRQDFAGKDRMIKVTNN